MDLFFKSKIKPLILKVLFFHLKERNGSYEWEPFHKNLSNDREPIRRLHLRLRLLAISFYRPRLITAALLGSAEPGLVVNSERDWGVGFLLSCACLTPICASPCQAHNFSTVTVRPDYWLTCYKPWHFTYLVSLKNARGLFQTTKA